MTEASQWFVLRDLSRPNALVSAYMRLTGEGIRCFTPLVKKRVTVGGRPVWRQARRTVTDAPVRQWAQARRTRGTI